MSNGGRLYQVGALTNVNLSTKDVAHTALETRVYLKCFFELYLAR